MAWMCHASLVTVHGAAALPYMDELVAGGTARNLEELINLLQESQSAQGAAIAS